MNQLTRKWIVDVCAYSIVFLFVYTATSKLSHLYVFQAQLARFPWVGSGAAVLAWAVPIMELAASALLLSRRTRRMGFYASLALMVSFTLYLACMLGSQEHLPCSCGGIVAWLSWQQHLVFNLFFTGITVAGLVFSPPKIKFYAT